VSSANVLTVEPLGGDIVVMAQCMAIDADAFPYPSTQFAIRAPSSRVWIARDESDEGGRRAVGFLAGYLRHGAMHVHGLAVDRAMRRRGVARALLRRAMDGARGEGLRTVALNVGVGNAAAVALYEAEGFAIVRRMRGFYPPGVYDGERDAYEMVRLL
jgi:ribosomal protein S18 acetylase RimI-like enzyme